MATALCDEHKPKRLRACELRAAARLSLDRGHLRRRRLRQPGAALAHADERKAFRAGERLFTIGGGTKVRVADDLFPN